jgi:hypothetical protein
MNPQKLFDDLANCLTELATDLTPGQVAELVEYATDEQNQWVTNGPGWKVLEAFKEFIQAD